MIRQGLAASVAFRIDAVLLAIGIVAFADRAEYQRSSTLCEDTGDGNDGLFK